MPSQKEIDRRYGNIRAAMQAEKVDALIVCGNQYAGFEGAVRYTSDFEIVHRYVYVLIPLSGDATLVFPREARWIGDKKAPFVREKTWAEIPGKWLREEAEKRHWKRVAVYGLDFIMAVRDYRELQQGSFELVPFDFHFDMARAVKSEEELDGLRDSMDIILDGFHALLAAYEPGKSEAEIMAPAVERFFARGAGPRMMNIVLSGTNGEAEASFKVPSLRKVGSDDLLLYSLEVTGAAGYWIEFSRALIRGKISPRTRAMSEVYPHAMEAARMRMRDGMVANEVHKAAADVFSNAGFALGHLTGHSIGMTMIEHPAIGASTQIELKENMVLSFHPQVVDQDGQVCLYTQDTYRVGKSEGECLADVPWRFYTGLEARKELMSVKVCIVGCGAIGSIFGAHLARLLDVEVHAYDVSQEHIRAINKRGLRISGAADFTSRLHATTNPKEIPVCEFGIVATKSTHTRPAIEQTAHVFDDSSAVCSVQNGVGNEEILAKHVRYVIRGTTFPAGHVVEPGHIGFDINGDTWIGPFEPTNTSYERVEKLAELLNRAGLKAIPLKDARGAQWTKLIFNASTNPVGALTLLHHGAATRFPQTGALFNALISEGEAVAKALGIQLHGDPRALVQKGANAPGKHKASMLQDILAKRQTEVDFMNGAIADSGEKLGVPTPLNRALWQLVKGLEHSWSDPV